MIFKYLSNNISISIGVAGFTCEESTFLDLYNKADNELYKVKRKGKGHYSIDV